jgi:peptide/nickel transport system substrate-binding protein
MLISSTSWSKTFRYPESTRPSSLIPFFVDQMSAVRITEFLFEPLVKKNKRGEMEGLLATGWQPSSSQTSITFQLRPNVKWHDGKPFTSKDVVFTVKAAQNPKTLFNSKGKFKFIKAVKAIDKMTVQFIFTRPIREPLPHFTFKILPAHSFRSKTKISRVHSFNRHPVGTGPYQFEKQTMHSIKLKRFNQYWGKASIDRVEMMHMPDQSEQINLLKFAGEGAGVQGVIFIPPKNMGAFENSSSVILEPYHTVAWWYIAFNHKNKALKDPEVRKAIAFALDREEILNAHLGQGDLLSGPFTESSPYYNFDVEPREVDLDEARSILDRAGYKKRGPYRRKGKTKLSFKFVLEKDLPNCQQIFLSMQAQLKQVGIEAKPLFIDTALYREKVFKKRDFDLTINIWTFKELENIYPLFKSNAAHNFINYSNAKVDKKLDESLARRRDYKVYKGIMQELHMMLNADLPYLFLWSLDIYSGLSRQLKNIFIQPYYYYSAFKGWAFK